MARRAHPVNIASGPLAGFARDLRDLRDRAGACAPTVDQISSRERIPRSTLYAALKGTRLPGRDVVAALARSWGGDEAEWLARRTALEADLAGGDKRRPATSSRSENFWTTVRSTRTVLVVVDGITSLTRMLSIVSLFDSDPRVALAFAVSTTSAFPQDVSATLKHLGIRTIPWTAATSGRFDLVLATSAHRHLESVNGPVMLLPSGISRTRPVGTSRGSRRAEFGLSQRWLTEGGDTAPDLMIALRDENERERLREDLPRLADRAVVVGDPYFGRIVASQPRRSHYRRVLGAGEEQKLVLLTSTWGSSSLLAEHPHLIQRLVAQLPVDEFRVCMVLHPNVWAAHGQFQIEAWFRDAIDGGLRLIRPCGGEEATLVAADLIIGDHGAVTAYAVALGYPVLRPGGPPLPDTGTTHLTADEPPAGDPLDPHRDLRAQVEMAITKRGALAPGTINNPSHEVASEQLKMLHGMLYELLELKPPTKPPLPRPVPEPTPQ